MHPTPRIGGVALAIAVGIPVIVFASGALAFPSDAILASTVLASTVPIFLIGIREDVFRDVSPRLRYGAAALSGLAAAAFLQAWIDRADPDWFSAWLAIAPIGIAVTVFTTASYAHAFNLIDGLNGLCAGTSILISAGLAAVAIQAGHDDLLPLLMLIAAGLSGFMLWNFPMGKIFLGDAGAYSIGHILSWIGVVLISSTTDVSAWAIMLIFFWPLADTLFAIARRLSTGERIDAPDRMHFHQLVMRALLLTILGSGRRSIANPLATIVLLPVIGATVVTGVVFWNDSQSAAIALATYGGAFVLMHRGLRLIARRNRLRPAKGLADA